MFGRRLVTGKARGRRRNGGGVRHKLSTRTPPMRPKRARSITLSPPSRKAEFAVLCSFFTRVPPVWASRDGVLTGREAKRKGAPRYVGGAEWRGKRRYRRGSDRQAGRPRAALSCFPIVPRPRRSAASAPRCGRWSSFV